MRKGPSSKTKKAVAKRFTLTAKGKLKRSQAGRRHLAASKNRKTKRQLASREVVAHADTKRMKVCLPFS
ncbi:MAG: 50S ribosomal protein L35 [Blastochloris sp.]|nr:50S ribosomal protein L35 [Blastochloris sp.]